MALLLNISTPFGLALPTAYAKVQAFAGDRTTLDVSVAWFVSQAARAADKRPLQVQRVTMPTPTGDLLTGIYTHLKSRADFAGAVDA